MQSKRQPPRLDRLMSMAEVCHVTSYSRASIYRLEKAGKFPKRVKIGDNKIGWRESDVLAWMASRKAAA